MSRRHKNKHIKTSELLELTHRSQRFLEQGLVLNADIMPIPLLSWSYRRDMHASRVVRCWALFSNRFWEKNSPLRRGERNGEFDSSTPILFHDSM